MTLRRTWVWLLTGLLAACGGGDDEPDDEGAASAGGAGTAGVAGKSGAAGASGGAAGKGGAAGQAGKGGSTAGAGGTAGASGGKGGTAGASGGKGGAGGSTAGSGGAAAGSGGAAAGSAGTGGAAAGSAGTGGAAAGSAGTGGAAAGSAGTGGAAAGSAGTGGAAAGSGGAGTCSGTAFLASLGKDRLLVGGAMEDATLSMAPFDVRYQYLSGGFPDSGTCASCASGCATKGTSCDNKGPGCNWWGCWQWDQVPPGQYVKDFIATTKKAGAVPMLTYYEQLQDSGAAEGKGQLAALTDPKITKRYYDDVRFLAQAIGTETVLVHLEPDLWGYFLQMGSPDPANVKVATASASADCAGQPENAAGFAGCLIGILRKHAPNARIALHASPWATNIDAVSNKDASVDVTAEAQKLAAHLAKLGALDGDFLVVDLSDRDAGFDQKNGEDTWMDATNAKLPHFHQAFAWVKALGAATKMPILWWQLPLGNAQQNDTTNHWKDNRVEYFFSHTDEVAQSNVVGILFGSGEPQQTNPETDGGFFVSRAKDYFSAGGVAPICPLSGSCRGRCPEPA